MRAGNLGDLGQSRGDGFDCRVEVLILGNRTPKHAHVTAPSASAIEQFCRVDSSCRRRSPSSSEFIRTLMSMHATSIPPSSNRRRVSRMPVGESSGSVGRSTTPAQEPDFHARVTVVRGKFNDLIDVVVGTSECAEPELEHRPPLSPTSLQESHRYPSTNIRCSPGRTVKLERANSVCCSELLHTCKIAPRNCRVRGFCGFFSITSGAASSMI
jgi:hypothetical protein